MGRRIDRVARHLLVLTILCAACTAVDDGQEVADDGAESDRAADFCRDADAFITDGSVTDIASFGPEFFADVDQRLAALAADAPAEIAADVEDLRTGFRTTEDVFTRFDYDVTDPDFVPALDEIDQDNMLQATENIEAFINQRCGGLTDGRSQDEDGDDGGGDIDQAQVDDIMTAFSVDRSLAECLNRELGDIANIDSSELTQELLSTPVCGTTLIGLLTGTG